MPSDDFGLVNVRVADIRLAALPLFPPLNMSCLRFSALSAFVDLVPKTNCMASPEFDLPEPFGPVIAVNPDWNGMDTSPPNDLKLRTSILTNRISQSPQSGFFHRFRREAALGGIINIEYQRGRSMSISRVDWNHRFFLCQGSIQWVFCDE